MALVLNTNVASLKAQNSLSKTSKKVNQALERLSTGLRINSGKDDVVGLAKSETLRSKIRGSDVARTNISNASAVLNVAEGTVGQLTEIAQSIRDLAVQAADDTISASDRASLSDNLTSLLAEYDRQATGANFNGVKLLDGTFTSKNIQVGADEGEQVSISIGDARSATIGKVAILTAQTRTAIITTTTRTSLAFGDPSGIIIEGVAIASTAFSDDGVSSLEGDESAIAYVNAINSYSGETGVTATVNANVITADYTAGVGLTATTDLRINGVTIDSGSTAYTSSDTDVADLVRLINEQSSETGVVATQDANNDDLILTAADGRNIDITITGGDTTVSTNLFGMTGSSSNRAVLRRGTFDLTSNNAFTVAGADTEFASASSVTTSLSATTTLDNVTFDTADDAATALSILDKVISQLQDRRADIGSTANRLDVADAQLASLSENLSAAQSAIRDADIAAETAKYTQYNILQQAGATVLAQANSSPQIALQLLNNL